SGPLAINQRQGSPRAKLPRGRAREGDRLPDPRLPGWGPSWTTPSRPSASSKGFHHLAGWSDLDSPGPPRRRRSATLRGHQGAAELGAAARRGYCGERKCREFWPGPRKAQAAASCGLSPGPPPPGQSPPWPFPAPRGLPAAACSGSCDPSGGAAARREGRPVSEKFRRPAGLPGQGGRGRAGPRSSPRAAGRRCGVGGAHGGRRSWGPGPGGGRRRGAAGTSEHLFKVLVIGELGVGKTSIIKRYVHQLFSQHYRATIGVDFALKVLNWDSRTLVRLQLWDIAGQERFGNMTRVYYKEAVGAFIVFDISRGSTFDAVLKWKSDLDSKVHLPNGSPIPAVLLANKCDQKKDSGQTPSQMDQFCKEHGFTGWFETSAKDNVNIDEAARFLVENILANHQSFPNEENDGRIKLEEETVKKESKTQCC
uniref:Ras-related protein Rab n=1 Tax=Bos mutus grunniens TaxID=30521 RepID=A0A8B9Y794_BOSMU